MTFSWKAIESGNYVAEKYELPLIIFCVYSNMPFTADYSKGMTQGLVSKIWHQY
jgi:hypothetical protein